MSDERIGLGDTPQSACIKLGEGNPRGLRVCVDLLAHGAEIDPDSAVGGLGNLLSLDTHKIYADRIWMLYKDVCGENLAHMAGVLRAVQLGILKESVLHHAIDHYGDGIDVNALLSAVAERLPRFRADWLPEAQAVAVAETAEEQEPDHA